MYYHYKTVSRVAHVGYVEFKSGVIFTVIRSHFQENGHISIVPCHEAAKFSSCSEVHVENKSEVDEINMEVRNRTELVLVGYKSKVH